MNKFGNAVIRKETSKNENSDKVIRIAEKKINFSREKNEHDIKKYQRKTNLCQIKTANY